MTHSIAKFLEIIYYTNNAEYCYGGQCGNKYIRARE